MITVRMTAALMSAAVASIVAIACSTPYTPGDNTGDDSIDTGDAGTAFPNQTSTDAAPAKCNHNPQSTCGTAQQCDCKQNETCDVQDPTTGAASCVPSTGQGGVGANCDSTSPNGTSQCLPGLTCLYNECRPYCGAANTVCNQPGTQICVPVKNAQSAPIPSMFVCTIACDPVKPADRCGANNCVWFPSYYKPYKVSDCTIPGAGADGSSCQSDEDCAQGYACGTNGLCSHWCMVGGAECPAGTSCVDVYQSNAPVVGGTREGLCQ
jgi:hypothetical protein